MEPYKSPGLTDSSEQHRGVAAGETNAALPYETQRLLAALLWVIVVVVGGVLLTNVAVRRYGELGMFVVWPIGWAAGFVAGKIVSRKSRLVGGLLVLACISIPVLAQVHWIQVNIEDAHGSWWRAFTLVPLFAQQFQVAAITAVCMAILGGISAWRQVAVRYVRVRVAE